MHQVEDLHGDEIGQHEQDRDELEQGLRVWPAKVTAYLASVVVFAAAATFAAVVFTSGAEESAVPDRAVTLPTRPSLSTPSSSPALPSTRPSLRVPTFSLLAHQPPRTPTPRRGAATGTVQLGTPDFGGYCKATGQGRARLVGVNAYGWGCSADNGTGNDAQEVCAWTYGIRQITNCASHFNDPHSWKCWHTRVGKLGNLDFDRYCEITGHRGAT